MIAVASAADADPFALRPGTRLGKYVVVRRLAVGGMAELYLVRVRGLRGFEKLCALKRPRPVLAADHEFVDSLLVEARIAGRLDHPNVAHVSDVDVVGNEHFFVMEYVHGHDLRHILAVGRERGGLPRECTLEIIAGVARGLHHAHECLGVDGRPLGIVHRDVSPSNVLVSFGGDVKIVDFGIAKAISDTRQTRSGTLKGKIGYMSPEQCAGEPVDRRTDVFGLGILLYELTTQTRPFRAESEIAVLNKIMAGSFTRPSSVVPEYPPALEAIVMRAMAVDRDDRHPTAEAFLRDVEAARDVLGLRGSSLLLADMMRSMFGVVTHPGLEVATTEASDDVAVLQSATVDDGTTRPVGAASRRASRTTPVRVAAGLTLVAGAVFGWLGATWSSRTTTARASPMLRMQIEPPHEDTAPALPPTAAPPTPSNDAEVGLASAPRSPEPTAKRGRPTGRTRSRAARRRPPADTKGATRIFPDAYYERDP